MKGPKPRPIADRFWEKVDRSGGEDACWPWTSSRNVQGYGRVKVGGRDLRASRVAYDLAHPDGPLGERIARHRCDNPPCVNPSHLEAGDYAQNSADRDSRLRAAKGARHGRARLTNEQVVEIRRRSAEGASIRQLAGEFPVSRSAIHLIVTRGTWASLPDVTADGGSGCQD